MNSRTAKYFTAALGAAVLAAAHGLTADAAAQTNAGSAASPTARLAELFGDTVVAKGKSVEVKRSQLDSEVSAIKTAAEARGQALLPGYERRVLDQLVNFQLLLNKATEADRAKGREQFGKSLLKFKADGKLSDADFDEKLGRQLRVQGLTREQWDKQNIEKATVPLVLERELKINVTDDAAKKYYDENPAKFEQPQMVRAGHILLMTIDPATRAPLPEAQKTAKRKQLEDILKRAKAGEDFARLAVENSEDPAAKGKDGEIKFARMQTGLPEFEAAAFSLATNQISDVITTAIGYHLIKLIENIPARKEPFAGPDTKTMLRKADGEIATIRDVLADEAVQKQLPDYIKQLKQAASVEILDEKLKAMEVPEPAPAAPAKPAEKK